MRKPDTLPFRSLFVFRTLLQWRKTGSTGIKGFHGPPGSLSWWAGTTVVVAMALALLAPLATLLGWPGGRLLFEHGLVHVGAKPFDRCFGRGQQALLPWIGLLDVPVELDQWLDADGLAVSHHQSLREREPIVVPKAAHHEGASQIVGAKGAPQVVALVHDLGIATLKRENASDCQRSGEREEGGPLVVVRRRGPVSLPRGVAYPIPELLRALL